MKVFVSIDFEGLPGVASVTMLGPKSPQFGIASEIATRVARVVAEELLRNGVDHVTIADSHGLMTNVKYLDMPRKTSLIQGYPRAFSMLSGLDESFAAAVFLGYHCAAGTRYGVLDHTYSGRAFYRIWVNGVKASEYLLNAYYAGELGVPVILVAGDHCLEVDVRNHTPWSVFIPLKRGVSRYAAEYSSFEEILESLRRAVYIALQRLRRREAKPLVPETPIELKIEFRDSIYADAAEALPKAERLDAYTIRVYLDTARDALGLIEVLALACGGIESIKRYA